MVSATLRREFSEFAAARIDAAYRKSLAHKEAQRGIEAAKDRITKLAGGDFTVAEDLERAVLIANDATVEAAYYAGLADGSGLTELLTGRRVDTAGR